MPPTRAACFITPHGFGHAARATAVMEAWHRIEPAVDFEVFTEVPKWFLRDSLDGPFTYHSLLTDIGMVQETPLREDLPATVSRLDAFLPFDPTEIVRLAEDVVRSRCKAVLCDIAPMGIAVAREAGIPSVLIENFTWDWIYRGYSAAEPAIEKHAAYMEKLFRSADVHVQAEPACVPSPNADLRAEPVSRRVRSPRKSIRERLGIPDGAVAVMITMGGTSAQAAVPEYLADRPDVHFIIPGGSPSIVQRGNLILLPYRSDFHHPDLIAASDAVVGKIGYSTLAEVFHAGVPFGYVTRPEFPESQALASFVQAQMAGLEITESQVGDGSWMARLPDLLSLPRIPRTGPSGAVQVATFLHDFLS